MAIGTGRARRGWTERAASGAEAAPEHPLANALFSFAFDRPRRARRVAGARAAAARTAGRDVFIGERRSLLRQQSGVSPVPCAGGSLSPRREPRPRRPRARLTRGPGGLAHHRRRADRRRAGGGGCAARPPGVGVAGWRAGHRPRRPHRDRVGDRSPASATSCCRPSMPSRIGSAGSPAARSTTSAVASPSRPRRRGACSRSITCSARARGRRAVAHVCDDIACRLQAPRALCADLESRLGPPLSGGHPAAPHDGDGARLAGDGHGAGTAREPRDAAMGWQRSPCLGQCDAGSGSPDHARRSSRRAVRRGAGPERAARWSTPWTVDAPDLFPARSGTSVRPGCWLGSGKADPTSLESYRAAGGYRALARAIELGPEARDRRRSPRPSSSAAAAPRFRPGASGTPSVGSRPCRTTSSATRTRASPGTFKDRELMASDPFAVVESMTICGLATASTPRVHLHPRRVPALRGADARTRFAPLARPACSVRT